MSNYHDLRVWQQAHAFTLELYKETEAFPSDERFGLTKQIRRSARSVGANLAEGSGRGSQPDFRRFVEYSLGSANELEYDLLLARDLGYLSEEQHKAWREKIVGLRRGLAALRRSLN